MHEHSFEDRYQSYLDLFRDNTPTMVELDAIERQINRLNSELSTAPIRPLHRVELLKIRNETMTALRAAQHRARIDEAREVARSITARPAPRQRRTSVAKPSAPALRRRPQQRDRGIER